MANWTWLVLLLNNASPFASAQFDSVYTHIAKDCESLSVPENDGSDPSLSCRGPDELVARIDFSAADAALNMVMDMQGVEQALESGILGIDVEKGVIEWRRVNDLPIAIIVRSFPMVLDVNGLAYRGAQQTLEIRGLNRLVGFSASIDTRSTPNANEVARQRIAEAWQQESK